MKAEGSYTVAKWEESPYEIISDTSRLTKASVEYQFSGGIRGKATVEYLMYYSHFDAKEQHNSAAKYVGVVRFDGTVGNKSGSFVLIDNGTFGSGAAESSLEIAAGSGAKELKGITGTGMYRADRNGCRIEIDFDIA